MAHWTKDERQVKTLAHVFQLLGLDGGTDDLLGMLGVLKIEEYKGSFGEALQILYGQAEAVKLQRQVQDLSQNLPEAPVTANASFQTPAGGVWQVTIRPVMTAELVVAAMKNMVTGVEMFETAVIKGRGWTPLGHYSKVPTGNGSGSGMGPDTGHASEQAGLYTRKGAGELVTLTVKGGKFEYDVAGRQYPIGDSRGHETATAYWSDDCFTGQFSRAMLEGNGVWERADFGQKLMVRYGKNKDTGYWDALAVYPEGEE